MFDRVFMPLFLSVDWKSYSGPSFKGSQHISFENVIKYPDTQNKIYYQGEKTIHSVSQLCLQCADITRNL